VIQIEKLAPNHAANSGENFSIITLASVPLPRPSYTPVSHTAQPMRAANPPDTL